MSDYFFSTLNGERYYDFVHKVLSLDRSVTSYKDRLAEVKKLIGDDSYFVTYFSKYFNPHLTKMNHLSDGNNICHLMEILCNYLLMSDEIREINKREKPYYIDSNHLNRQNDKAGAINEQNGKNNEMVVQFNKENYKKDKKVSVHKSDFDDSVEGRAMKDQQDGIDYATRKMHAHKGNSYSLAKMKHELIQDQIVTKISKDGIFDLDSFQADSSADDYYCTLSEPKTVKSMLSMPHERAVRKTVYQCLYIDLWHLIKKIHLSNSDRFIIGLYHLGYTLDDIADLHRDDSGRHKPCSEQYISRRLNQICKKISRCNYDHNLSSLKRLVRRQNQVNLHDLKIKKDKEIREEVMPRL